jgi:hypothetical protein
LAALNGELADSWVAEFLAWWNHYETRLLTLRRAGVEPCYARFAEKIVPADRLEASMHYRPWPKDLQPSVDPLQPIRVTFIPATVFTNPLCCTSARDISPGRCRC